MDVKLGEKIRQRRKQMGLTLKELAGTRVTAAQISAVEKAKCKPSPGLLNYIAERLEVDVEYFTLTEEERYRKRFDEIKNQSKELFGQEDYEGCKSKINEAADVVAHLTDIQKGEFYYIQANCLYNQEKYLQAFDYYVKSLTYYLKTKDINTTTDIYIKTGNCLYSTNQHDMALGYYLSAKGYINDKLDCDHVARIYYNLALCYIALKRYNLASEYQSMCAKFLEENEWPRKERFYPGLDMINGSLGNEMNQNQEAVEKFEEAFEKYKKKGDIAGMGRARNNAAICLYDTGDYEKAIHYLKEAIDYKTICSDGTLVDTYLNLAEIYKETKEIDKAIEIINIAEEKMINQNHTKGIIEVFTTKFEYYSDLGEFDRAEVFAFLALDYIEKSGDLKAEANLYIKLSEMYKKIGDEKSSIDYVVKAKSLMM